MPVLARKPGALRNGAPFNDWVLPAAMERVRRKLAGADDGNRQMVDILSAVLTDGLPGVEAACAEAIAHGVHSADDRAGSRRRFYNVVDLALFDVTGLSVIVRVYYEINSVGDRWHSGEKCLLEAVHR